MGQIESSLTTDLKRTSYRQKADNTDTGLKRTSYGLHTDILKQTGSRQEADTRKRTSERIHQKADIGQKAY